MKRAWIAVPMAALLVLSGCSAPSPTAAQDAAATRYRSAAASRVAAAPVLLDAGSRIIGDRTDDLCGSLTSDRGGLDDAHVEGYECVMVRRIAVIVPGSALDENPAIALGNAFVRTNGYASSGATGDSGRWSVDVALTDTFQPSTGRNPAVRLSAQVMPVADMLSSTSAFPLYHANGIEVSHRGRLDRATLAAGRREHSDFGLLVTIKDRYYNSYEGPR